MEKFQMTRMARTNMTHKISVTLFDYLLPQIFHNEIFNCDFHREAYFHKKNAQRTLFDGGIVGRDLRDFNNLPIDIKVAWFFVISVHQVASSAFICLNCSDLHLHV